MVNTEIFKQQIEHPIPHLFRINPNLAWLADGIQLVAVCITNFSQ